MEKEPLKNIKVQNQNHKNLTNTINHNFVKKVQNIIKQEKKDYINSSEAMATRKSSEKILNILTKKKYQN